MWSVVLICISLMIMMSISSWSCWSCVFLLLRNVYSSKSSAILIGLFIFLRLSFMSSLDILDVNPLLYMYCICFANIFSPSIGYFFTLLIVSLAVQNFLVWYSPTWLLLPFCLCLCCHDQKIVIEANVNNIFSYIFF